VTIEQAFGVLKRRFPCLGYGLRVQPQLCCDVIVGCVFLHNYGIDNGDIIDRVGDWKLPDQLNVQPDVDAPQNGLTFRDMFAVRHFS